MAGTSVAVVGGGITGAFAAYSLARLDVSVTLVERSEIESGASWRNPGGLNPLHGPGIPGPLQALALSSFHHHVDGWDELRALSKIDFGGRRAPRLQLAFDDDDRATLDDRHALYSQTDGFSAEWIDRDTLLADEPRLSPAVAGALLTEGNAKVESAAYTRAVVAAAVALGATELRAEARGLRHAAGRATAVVLDSGDLACDDVVVATGPWCAQPADWLDIELPVTPVKGELLRALPAGGGVRTDLAWREAAVYRTGTESVWLGGTEARTGFEDGPTEDGEATILRGVERVLPGFAPLAVEHRQAALRPATPDGLPIAGRAPGWDNVYLALGGGRKGMLLAAGLGRALAELLTTGTTSTPIAAFSPGRFAC
jgi:glycine oxidase